MKNKSNSILSSFTALSVLFILLVSCQKTQYYIPVYYNITNNTNSKIYVYYNVKITHYGGQSNDSIFLVQSGSKSTILVLLNRQNYNSGNPETEDTLTKITDIRIYNSDSIVSYKNFCLTKYWEYSEMTSKSDLDLNVNPEDF